MGWIQRNVTGDHAKVAKFEKAQKALEDYRGGDGSVNDKEFNRLNKAAHEAAKDVPAAVRNRW